MNRLRAPRVDRLAVRDGPHLKVVRTDSIDWVEAADNYVILHCGSTTHILRETMNALESTLDPVSFVRIHRSTIVNLDRIKELQPWFRGDYGVDSSGRHSPDHEPHLQGREFRAGCSRWV